MPKFVVIDPSVQDFQGHYWEYAMRVLRAAEAKGYSPVLAANRRFRMQETAEAKVCSVYRYAFWLSLTDGGPLRWLKKCVGAVKQLYIRPKVQLVFSSLGLFWTLRRNLRKYVQRRSLTSRSTLPVFLLLGVSYLARVAVACVRLAWYAVPFHGYFRRLGLGFRRLAGAALLPLSRLFDSRGPAVQSMWTRTKMKQFAKDTERLFRKIPLEEGDSVFLTCVSLVEVVALAKYFRRNPLSSRAQWHLMFRHQLYNPDQQGPDNEACRSIRNAFRIFRESLAGHRVNFFTDTEDLAQHYNMLRVFDFRSLPVPVSDEYHSSRRKQIPASPLRIAYVGDAREEKGYHYLPRIVGDLWSDYVSTGRVEFSIQSNFATPGGTPETVVSRAQLEAFPPDKVKLFTEPLDGSGYRNLVLGADLILLPYTNPAHYFAASSGILVEALSAGTPVIVPAGTWLSIQLTQPIYRYHRGLRERVPIVGTLHGEDIDWRVGDASLMRGLEDGRLLLSGERRSCTIPVPGTATHFLASFRPLAKQRGRFVEIGVKQYGGLGNLAGERTCVVGGDDSPASVLIPLEPNARRLKVTCGTAFNRDLIELSEIRMDFLRSKANLPLSAVGLVFSSPEQLTGMTREIIDHYTHYHGTAQEFSTEWVEYHNVGNLVEMLAGGTSRAVESTGEQVPRAPKFLATRRHAQFRKEQACTDPS